MKKLFKIAVNFMALALLTLCTFGLAACEDIKRLELDLTIYNFTDKEFYDAADVKFTVDLYRHLADETVDAVLDHVKNDYYKDAIFYKESGYSSQIMMGDLKMVNGELCLNLIDGKLPSQIDGEFENNGTAGSDLVNEKGYIGLWRSWYASGESDYKNNNGMDSGRATWYIPTTTISGYDGYFCIFAKYDKTNTANATAISALTSVFASSENYEEYVIYYTGEYDADKADESFNLEFHAVLKSEFDGEDFNKDAVFEAEDDQFVYYNARTVYIPKTVDGKIGAKVNSVKIK